MSGVANEISELYRRPYSESSPTTYNHTTGGTPQQSPTRPHTAAASHGSPMSVVGRQRPQTAQSFNRNVGFSYLRPKSAGSVRKMTWNDLRGVRVSSEDSTSGVFHSVGRKMPTPLNVMSHLHAQAANRDNVVPRLPFYGPSGFDADTVAMRGLQMVNEQACRGASFGDNNDVSRPGTKERLMAMETLEKTMTGGEPAGGRRREPVPGSFAAHVATSQPVEFQLSVANLLSGGPRKMLRSAGRGKLADLLNPKGRPGSAKLDPTCAPARAAREKIEESLQGAPLVSTAVVHSLELDFESIKRSKEGACASSDVLTVDQRLRRALAPPDVAKNAEKSILFFERRRAVNEEQKRREAGKVWGGKLAKKKE